MAWAAADSGKERRRQAIGEIDGLRGAGAWLLWRPTSSSPPESSSAVQSFAQRACDARTSFLHGPSPVAVGT